MPIVNCQNCNKEMRVEPARLAKGWGKYCSNRCAREHREKLMHSVCPYCGRKFRRRFAVQKYCSKLCGDSSRVINRPTPELGMNRVWISDLPIADRVGELITAAGESLGLGYEIAF